MPYNSLIRNHQMKVNGYEIKPGAKLECANLKGANLVGADLEGANLWGAKL